jgi:phosphinothricin acetyltransferase
MVRLATLADTREIADIYNYYITNSIITFEEIEISTEMMLDRIQVTLGHQLPWLVYEDEKGISGYAYAGKWNARSAYKHSAEVTVYLRHGETGRGLGSLLYKELIAQLRSMDFHAIIGGIALPNAPSVALHEKLGFEKVAHYREVGFKFNQWIDVGYWQLKTAWKTVNSPME